MPRYQASSGSRKSFGCLNCLIKGCALRQDRDSQSGNARIEMPTSMTVMPGAMPLFCAGDPQESLYVVRAGCIKTYTLDIGGKERIRGFYLPGDLIGLDAFESGRFPSSAAALEPSQVCAVPVAELRRAMHFEPRLSLRLIAQMSRELAFALALAGDFTAEQRLAAFLLSMERRLMAKDGFLRLPMSQRDVGNYLRLTPETVCRTLKGFSRNNWLRREHHGVRLLARQALQRAAEAVGILQPEVVEPAAA